MIVAHKDASINEFDLLMKRTDLMLNSEAQSSPNKFKEHNGLKLENDVYEALCVSAEGSCFENEIELVSGAKFPDIKIGKNFGVEVKSTSKNHWTSIGSSILESTRLHDIQRIYMTFGKLAKPVEFISKPYEKCLSGIAVTHAPRYTIDMTLNDDGNIFSKMGVQYDDFRTNENPAKVFTNYYKEHLSKGQSLWWIDDDDESNQTSPTITLWNYLPQEQRKELLIKSLVLFPELLMNKDNRTKYNRVSLWLARQSIVHNNIRDNYSAGGQYLQNFEGEDLKLPGYFQRIIDHIKEIRKIISQIPDEEILRYWKLDCRTDRFSMWIDIILKNNLEFFKNREQAERFFTSFIK